MGRYLGGFYQRQLGFYLKHLIGLHKESLRPLEKKMGITIEEMLTRTKTCRDVESYIMKYSLSFGTSENYCRQASSVLRIPDVKTPLFLLSPLDDPVVPYFWLGLARDSVIPYGECVLNENIILGTHPSGGHLGFFTGINPKQWFAAPVMGYIEAVEKFHKAQH